MRFSAVLLFPLLAASTLAAPSPFTAKIQDGGSEVNRGHLNNAITLANAMIDKLETASDAGIHTAFGKGVSVAEVKACIMKLKTGRIFFDGADADARVTLAGTLPNNHIIFGSAFFTSQTDAFRAGTIVHEASHALCGTVDWFDKTTCAPVKTTANAWNGYADSPDFKTVQEKCGKNMHLNADSYRLLATQ